MSECSINRHESISRFTNFTSELRHGLTSIQGFDEIPLVSLEEAIKSLTSLVLQIDRMFWIIERYADEFNDNLSKDERMTIMLYTLEWIPNENSFYFILNSTLRSQNQTQMKPWFPYLRLLINAISKLPSNREKIIYRGVQMDLSNDYPEGKEFTWWSFTSCTSSLNVLEKYIGQNGTRTIFNIISYSGKDISQYSYFEEEKEILFYPARQFKVKSCINAGNQLHIIQVEEIKSNIPFFHISRLLNSPNGRQTSIDNISLQRQVIFPLDNHNFLYDINRDCVIKFSNTHDIKRTSHSYQKISCHITNGYIDKNKNLLKILNLQNELRLEIVQELRYSIY